jgi:hypothetical protein
MSSVFYYLKRSPVDDVVYVVKELSHLPRITPIDGQISDVLREQGDPNCALILFGRINLKRGNNLGAAEYLG